MSASDSLTALIQRVVDHVRASQARGDLPRLPDASSPQTAVEPSGLLLPLHALLTAHRAGDEAVATVLADVLACACFGSHHLWQDLGASGRDEVSSLMRLGFPALHDSNHRNLRWKRHLFLVLGEQLGRDDLRPPKCDDCDHYDACFGSPAPTDTKTWPLTPTT